MILSSYCCCNAQELFQGRGKGFDVEKALSASSIWDFEKAISMVSYGIDTIDEFYAKSSTRDVVGKVEVPLLFIQVLYPYYDAMTLFCPGNLLIFCSN